MNLSIKRMSSANVSSRWHLQVTHAVYVLCYTRKHDSQFDNVLRHAMWRYERFRRKVGKHTYLPMHKSPS